jgi:hypothetical protein
MLTGNFDRELVRMRARVVNRRVRHQTEHLRDTTAATREIDARIVAAGASPIRLEADAMPNANATARHAGMTIKGSTSSWDSA